MTDRRAGGDRGAGRTARLVAAGLFTIGGVLAGARVARAQEGPDLAGTWEGTLEDHPARPGAPRVDVTIELGALPTADSTCVPWRTTYREQGTVRMVKDYRLCRGQGAADLYVDEGEGLRLRADLIGGLLLSTFKAGTVLLTTRLAVRGDTLVEEIITAEDAPATDGVVSLRTRGVQRLTVVRRSRVPAGAPARWTPR